MSLLDKLNKFKEKTEDIIEKTKEIKQELEKKDEPKAKQTKITQTTRRKSYSAKSEIDKLKTEMENLRNSIIDSKNEIVITEKPVIDAIMKEFGILDIEEYQNRLIKKYNLKSLDIYVADKNGRRKPLFWDLSSIRKNYPEFTQDKETWDRIRLINRFYRGDKAFYKFVIRDMKSWIMEIIENKSKIE